MIFGVDVEDYVGELEEDIGPIVWSIPWLYYTDQTSSFRGWGCLLAPPWILGRMVRSLFAGGPVLPRPHPKDHPNRMTLREIAEIIDAGGWPQDRKPD